MITKEELQVLKNIKNSVYISYREIVDGFETNDDEVDEVFQDLFKLDKKLANIIDEQENQ